MFNKREGIGPQPNQNGWYSSGPRQRSVYTRSHTPENTPEQTPKEREEPSFLCPALQKEVVCRPVITPQFDERRTKKPRRGIGAGLVAVLLIVSLIGGALGGAAATWHMGNMAEEMPAYEEESSLPALAQPAGLEAPDPEPAAAGPATFDVTYAVERAAASVVEISLNTRVRSFFGVERDSQSAGSGVILTQDGYIVTNNHVIEAGGEIVVRTYDGREFTAQLIGTDVRTDLAVLKIDARGLVPAEITDSDAVRVGQIAVAIGNPLGTLGGTVTHGIVSAMDREITIEGQPMTLMQTSAAVNPGNSGGGLFNASGELIGVVNAKSTGMAIEGLGFAIPSNIVRQVTGDLIRHGYVTGRTELGIRVAQINNERDARHHNVDGFGIFIVSVTRENGLLARDQILYIDGVEIETVAQVSELVQAASVGDIMQVTVLRNGEVLDIDVTVSEHIPEHIRANLPEPSDM